MKIPRRDFIATLAAAAAAPMFAPQAVRAQQRIPLVGFLHIGSPDAFALQLAAFRKGLGEVGYVEGQNVMIEYRWAERQFDRLPALAADLAGRQVAAIATGALPAALAAKAATATIPIVFAIGGDPVKFGLVDSFNRPGRNLTGVTQLNNVLAPKQFELLHELAPKARTIGMLVNSKNPNASNDAKEVQAAAHGLGLKLIVLNVASDQDIEATFATVVEQRIDALLAGIALSLGRRPDQVISLAARYAIPTIYPWREDAAAGGLMSYGSDQAEPYREVGAYVGKILKGAKPADLPVQQATKVELVINLKTAKALGLEVPMALLMRVDEVIE